jgi:hypothetical protein
MPVQVVWGKITHQKCTPVGYAYIKGRQVTIDVLHEYRKVESA